MKITILKENLAYGLGIAARAASTRSPLPILQNILITAEAGALRLSATNLELSLSCQVKAQVGLAGQCTVPAATLVELVKTLPEGPIILDWNEATQTLHLRGAGETTKTQLKGISAEDFPPIEPLGHIPFIHIQAGTLKELIRQVTIAASKDEARPSLTGVLCTLDPSGSLSLAAADGFRLAVVSCPLPPKDISQIDSLTSESTMGLEAIIPVRALVELTRILPHDREVSIFIEQGRIRFQTEEIQLTSQLIDARFPDYTQVIPNSFQTRAIFNREAFLNACKQAGIFARESAQIARLSLQSGKLQISAQSEETGSNESIIPADVEGPELDIVFNVRFLQDVAEVIPASNLQMETTASNAPGVFRIPDQASCVHVLMPMNS